MFITPIPPTSNEMPAMLPMMAVMMPVIWPIPFTANASMLNTGYKSSVWWARFKRSAAFSPSDLERFRVFRLQRHLADVAFPYRVRHVFQGTYTSLAPRAKTPVGFSKTIISTGCDPDADYLRADSAVFAEKFFLRRSFPTSATRSSRRESQRT